jgi:hypothetical protein
MRYITAFILGISMISFSHAQNAAIHISLQDSAFFVCTFDGVDYKDASQVITINDLQSGIHRLEIKKLKTMGKSTIEQPSFTGEIHLENNIRSHYQVDRFNQIKLISKESYTSGTKNSTTNKRVWVPNPNQIPSNTQVITNANGMSNDKFAEQMELLKGNANENLRYKLAEDLLSLGTLKSSQVAEMMLLFENESNRVRLADKGEAYVTDPQNYGLVFEALRRPSSVRRLTRKLNN